MERKASASHLRAFRWYRRSRLWVVPTLGAAAALVLAVCSLSADYFIIADGAPFPVFSGAPETAYTILSLISTAIATLTALVLTVMAVVIQLATQSLSPRAVRTFLQDARIHLTVGTFVTTFTYALVVLVQFDLTYGGNQSVDQAAVSSSSVTIAFVLAVISLGMFISYVDHIVHEARVTSIIDRIGNETRLAIDEEYPPAGEEAPVVEGELPDREPGQVIPSPRHGVILEIDVAALMEVIRQGNALVVMVPAVGDFIPTGGRLFEVHGDVDVDVEALMATVEIDAERSIMQDIPFGFRLLIDIAERSLSPGINDPTTATQVVDQLHDLLRRVGSRRLPNGWHADSRGEARLFVPQPDWDLYVALAFEEIRHHGSTSLQVVRRLRSVVEDLLDHLPEGRHAPLHRQLRILDETADQAFTSESERQAARYADAQGIGSGGGFGPLERDGTAHAAVSVAEPEIESVEVGRER